MPSNDSDTVRKNRYEVAIKLARVLADSYTLYLKSHNFHWNVTGPQFPQLHNLFEAQYQELAKAIDVIAERIRALGEPAPGSYSAFGKLTVLREAEGVPAALSMVQILADDHETVAETARQVLAIAQAAKDEATADLLIARIDAHDKAAWMLRATAA